MNSAWPICRLVRPLGDQCKRPQLCPGQAKRGRRGPGHLGRRHGVDLLSELDAAARNVTGLVDALQRDGLVERLPHPNDWRAVLVRLTPAGERVSGELLAEQRAALAELLAELPEADQRSLLQALESLRAVLARHPEL
jgi:DNA-binding MarR family transcriptional regulator